MDRLIQMGKDLGYAGEKLQDFVKQQQDYERGRGSQKGNLKGIESRRKRISSRRKKLRQIRKGNLKGIESRRKSISSRRKKLRQIRKGNLKGIESRRKKKIGKSS